MYLSPRDDGYDQRADRRRDDRHRRAHPPPRAHRRRRGALAGLAGCTALDVATGEPAEFTAGTATVADAALDESGYELNEVTENTQTREFDVAGSTREVRVTSTIAEYDKAVELFGERYQAAVFAVLTTRASRCSGRRSTPSESSTTRSAPG